MTQAFDASTPPFDRLDARQVETLRAALDIGYYRPGETLIAQNAPSESLFIVLKGTVEERDRDELIALLGPGDAFDSRAIVQGESGHAFVARDECLCWLAPKVVILDLIKRSPRFAAFFYLDISRKLDALEREAEDQRVGSLMRARLAEVFTHPAQFIDAGESIEAAGLQMQDCNSNTLFVRDAGRVGVITGMNLAKGVILRRLPLETPVRELAHFDVVRLRPDDFVFEALLLMTKRNKRRVALHDGERYVGIIEDIDLLSFIAGATQIVAGRIDRATSLDELGAAAAEINPQVRVLRRQGLKVQVIAEIVSDLNRRLLARLFELVAPASIREAGCLIVMGSEGRGEQTIRTDQDNGLILSRPVDEADLTQFRAAFSGALEQFGFPPCPGRVMVSNPFWSRPLADFVEDFRRWLTLPDEDTQLNIAIFIDAEAVAGDAALLEQAKKALIDGMRGEQATLARFAKAVDAFETPIGLFNQLITAEGKGDALDLKRGGIFPIVHGARALALEKGVTETGTTARLAKLGRLGMLRPEFVSELVDAFQFLMTLRLDSQLAQAAGGSGALVRPAELSTMERDLLRDAFRVVKQFREIVRRHFNLGMF